MYVWHVSNFHQLSANGLQLEMREPKVLVETGNTIRHGVVHIRQVECFGARMRKIPGNSNTEDQHHRTWVGGCRCENFECCERCCVDPGHTWHYGKAAERETNELFGNCTLSE